MWGTSGVSGNRHSERGCTWAVFLPGGQVPFHSAGGRACPAPNQRQVSNYAGASRISHCRFNCVCARRRHFVWSMRAGFCVRLVCDFCLCMLSLIAGQLKPNPDSVSVSDTVTHLFVGRDSGGVSPSGPGRRGGVGAPGPGSQTFGFGWVGIVQGR